MIKTVRCPTCDKSVVWNEQSPFRPFCCERCRLIDLGAWAAEEHRIPSDNPPDFPEDSPGRELENKGHS